MMQVIDEDYIAGIAALPDGNRRLLDWVTSLIDQRDTAEQIAKCTVAQIQPLKKRVDQLLDANNRLVFDKRDLRTELQAEIDAMAAELDEHRRNLKIATVMRDAEDTAIDKYIELQEEAVGLLAWFNQRHDLDLSYQYDLEPSQIPRALQKPGPIPEEGWCVHKSHGGRNDREWDIVAIEETAIEALRAAHKAFCDGR